MEPFEFLSKRFAFIAPGMPQIAIEQLHRS
jgi:hypothetical protein